MDKEFPGSANLAVILKWHGWGLYDITTELPRERAFSWNDLEGSEAASYQIGHRYYLLPSPKEGESVKQSYAALREAQIHPILRIPKILSNEDKRLDIVAYDGFTDHNFNCYFLNEFYFQEKRLSTSTYVFFAYNFLSNVSIPTPQVVDAFSRYFCLIQFTDKGTVIKNPAQDVGGIN